MLFKTSTECKAQARAHLIEARRARSADWAHKPYGQAHIKTNVTQAGVWRREAVRLAEMGR